ncbi:hypothetical protein [Phaffia rhodozyma]|uniref:Uncharacterized protein n=1 Tax=Phaffia rhodozyma TaxID=264483 RepID=A0A0F7SGG5_PHARH|nr:hypothetical protein [Phaffia rhodozyma]
MHTDMLAPIDAHQPSTWSFNIENTSGDDSFDNDLTPLPTLEGVSPFFVSPEDELDGSLHQSFVADAQPLIGLPFGFAQELNTQSSLQQNYFPWSSTWRSFQQANQVRRASAGSLDSDRDRNGSASSSCNGERRDSYYQGSIGTNDDGWDDLYEDPEYNCAPPPSLPLPSLPIADGFSALSLAIENEFSSSCSSCSSREAGDQYANAEDEESANRYDYDSGVETSMTQRAQDLPGNFDFRPHSDSFSSETSQLSFSRFEVEYAQFSQTVPKMTTMITAATVSYRPEPVQDSFEHDEDDDDDEEEEKDVRTPGLVCGIRYSHHKDQQPSFFFDHQSRKTGPLSVWKESSVSADPHLEVDVVGEV